jgi:cell division protein FtsB
MAKALIGYLSSDQRSVATLAAENRRLRTRVTDLQAMVLRLQAENDRLAAAVREDSRVDVEDLQPA